VQEARLQLLQTGISLINQSRSLISQYNNLPPAQQELMRDQAGALRGAMAEMTTLLKHRRAARDRIAQLSAGAEEALHPTPEFETAKALTEYLYAEGPVSLHELDEAAAAIGGEDANDPEFTEALRIASNDGRILVVRQPDGGEALAATTSDLLTQQDGPADTAGEEEAIMRHLESAGIESTEALASAANKLAASDTRFALALAKLVERRQVEWIAAGSYGLTEGRIQDKLADERERDTGVREAGVKLYRAARSLSNNLSELRDAPAGLPPGWQPTMPGQSPAERFDEVQEFESEFGDPEQGPIAPPGQRFLEH
jgi:hypothetical protein